MVAAPSPRTFRLRDGSAVRIRPIRAEDKALLRRGFERLSADSRYQRFLSPTPRLSNPAVAYLTEVDHHDHEALLALDSGNGEAIGVARFVRDQNDRATAEAAVVVADDWQGRGLGTLLLEQLADRARAERVARFGALVLATNQDMLDLLGRLGPLRVAHRESGTVEVMVDLPGAGIGDELQGLLRASAAGRTGGDGGASASSAARP